MDVCNGDEGTGLEACNLLWALSEAAVGAAEPRSPSINIPALVALLLTDGLGFNEGELCDLNTALVRGGDDVGGRDEG